MQAGFTFDFIVAEGFHSNGTDCFHDAWRKSLVSLATGRPERLVFLQSDISCGDPIVLEEVFKGENDARLMDAWLDTVSCGKARQASCYKGFIIYLGGGWVVCRLPLILGSPTQPR